MFFKIIIIEDDLAWPGRAAHLTSAGDQSNKGVSISDIKSRIDAESWKINVISFSLQWIKVIY